MAQTVVGLFDNAAEAQQAVQQLINKGFSRDNIDVSTSGSTGSDSSLSGGIGSNTYSGASSSDTGLSGTSGSSSLAGSSSSDILGTSSGNLGTSSGSLGTSSGNLGTSSGSLGTSSDSPSYGTSGSGTSFTGSSTRSSEHEGTGSGIGRFFKSLFGDDDDEADRYTGVAQRSNAVVTVHAQSSEEAEQAADILDDAGAIDVNERASQYGYSSGTTSSDAGSSNLTDRASTDSTSSIPIIEEELQVGKRTVQTGGARLRSRIIERPVEESVRLREERVRVDRNTVDRPATEADFAAFKEGTIELTESAEVPVVSKEARVVEEVSLGKEVEEREETVRDTVRKTEVDVEKLDSDNLSNRSTNLGNSGNL